MHRMVPAQKSAAHKRLRIKVVDQELKVKLMLGFKAALIQLYLENND